MPRKPRIIIPENPAELFELAALIYAQHQRLGTKSPLHALEELPSWDEVGPKVGEATEVQSQIDKLEKNLKALYGKRQQYDDVVQPQTRGPRDLLTGVYSQNLRRLGEFGFEVIEGPEPKKPGSDPAKP